MVDMAQNLVPRLFSTQWRSQEQYCIYLLVYNVLHSFSMARNIMARVKNKAKTMENKIDMTLGKLIEMAVQLYNPVSL